MTEVAQIYIGNINSDAELSKQIAKAKESHSLLEVFLKKSDRSKGRIFARSTKEIAVGIIKSRDLKLKEGDVFQTINKTFLLVHIKKETLMVLHFTEAINSNSALKLVRLGHLLGNQHYPIKIEESNSKVYVSVNTNDKVIVRAIKELNISGLNISWEENCFETDLINHNHH